MWKDLTMQQRADVISMAVKAGMRDMNSIRSFYDKSIESRREYRKGGYLDWKNKASKYKHLDIDNDNTYDYEGWYNENPQRAWDLLNDSPNAHFDDKYKTVYHPTFSTQSKYSGVVHSQFNPQGLKGGSWSKDNHTFTMSSDGYSGPVNMDERQQYLIDAEDYGVQLREADGSLPIYDNIIWGGVLPNVTVMPRKFGGGGNKGRYWVDDDTMLPELLITPKGNSIVRDEVGNPALTVGAIRDINPNATIYERVNRELKNNQYNTELPQWIVDMNADRYANTVSPGIGDLVTAGLKPLDAMMPSRWVGLLDSDNNKGLAHLFDEDNRGFFIGNDPTKPFSKRYAEEHPSWATAGNLVGDVLTGYGIGKSMSVLSKGRKASKININSKNIDKVPEEELNRQFRAAKARGDKKEGQRLWDLWFTNKTKGNKAVDANGNPARTYHTVADKYDPAFTIFNPDIEGFNSAVYTTDNPFMSGTYTRSLTSEAERDHIIETTRKNLLEQYNRYVDKDNKIIKDAIAIYSNPKKARKQILKDHQWLNGPIVPERQKSLYVNLQNPVIMDNRGQNWNNLSLSELPEDVYKNIRVDLRSGYLSNNYSTRSLEEAQKATGNYDGSIIKNVTDYGGQKEYNYHEPSTVYQVNDPRYLKSAEPFTYDDAGNLIDLTHRADFNNPDIRYAIAPILAGGVGYGVYNDQKALGGNLFGGGGIFEDMGLGQVGSTLDTVTSYLPIASSIQDTYSFIKEPSWENLGWAAASIGTDLIGAGLLKGVKAATKTYKAAKKAEETAKKALETHRKTNRNIIARSVREEDKALQNAYNNLRVETALANPFWDKVIEYPVAGAWMLEDAGINHIQNTRKNYLNNKKALGGSIHIAPSKRGTFTAAASKHGMGVQEFARKVLANKDNYSPAMVKKANFARNASKWKH